MQNHKRCHFPWPNRLKQLLSFCNHRAPTSQLHALTTTTGLTNSTASVIVGFLIAAYARIGLIVSSRKVFDELPQRTLQVWNSMIIAYSRVNESRNVLNLYDAMVSAGVLPDSSTFTMAVKACGMLMELEMGETIWDRAVREGYGGDVFVGASVLNMYVKCGNIDKAMVVFERMVEKDVVCWSTVITGLVQSGRALEAIEFFRRMQKEGIEGDGVEMLGLIQACTNLGGVNSRLGRSVHGFMIRRLILMNDVVIQTSFVDMYVKYGNLDVALRMFRRMPRKSSVSWGALISGFVQNSFAEDALELLVEMQKLGFEPDLVCVLGAVSACSQLGNLKLGRSLHAYVLRSLQFEYFLGNALIKMYAQCGALLCSRVLFDLIRSKDIILWNTMIANYGIHGYGKEALSLFLDMREANLEPDDATFVSLLSAFSHAGMVEDGKFWFDFMINKSNVRPNEKHYACMIDLMSRAGHLEEAYKLITSMKFEPGLVTWVALLSGCLNHRNFELGEIAAKKILEFKPDGLGVYNLVSNFFSVAKKWDESATLKNMMRNSGGLKVPGYSAVEVNGRYQAFLMEDVSHHQYVEVKVTVEDLFREMRTKRYAAEIEFV